jgi:hypothetical protein
MKKLLTFALTLSLVSCLASCKDSDESSKTDELEKRVAELESQISEQSTTTTTTTTASTTTTTTTEKSTTTSTTTTSATTTTAQAFDTTWYEYSSDETVEANYDVILYKAPDKNSEALYEFPAGTQFVVKGRANSDWLAVVMNDEIVFLQAAPVSLVLTTPAEVYPE